MRGVLIGSDLMYRQDGRLVPIEINTNVGWDSANRKETEKEALDPSDIIRYAEEHGITDIYFEGKAIKVMDVWPANSSVHAHQLTSEELDEFQDSETDLVIRTSYSDEAYVDNFCRDKINFLKAIKDKDYGSEFILKSKGELSGQITSLYQNGEYPNIIVKYRYPNYDRSVYPLCLHFNSLEDLQRYAEEELEDDYFMMPFYYNATHGIYTEEEAGHRDHKRILFFRNWSIYVANKAGSLDSVEVGGYTKFTGILDESKLAWNEDGTAVDPDAVRKMLFQDKWVKSKMADLLLDEDDVVLMEDQTWKKAQELAVGDKVQAISIPVSGTVDIRSHTADYNVPYEEFAEESHWVVNEITNIYSVETWIEEVAFTFTDGTGWYDTKQSSYPTLDPEDNSVKFVELADLKAGTKIILMPFDAESLENPTFVVREVESVKVRRKLQIGYSISLDGNHLFLSRTPEDTLAYIAIEHNFMSNCVVSFSIDECNSYCSQYPDRCAGRSCGNWVDNCVLTGLSSALGVPLEFCYFPAPGESHRAMCLGDRGISEGTCKDCY